MLLYRIGQKYRSHLLPWFRILFGLSGFISGAILILDIGFEYPESYNRPVYLVVQIVLFIFVLYEFLGWLFTDGTFRDHLKKHRVELILAFLVAVQLLFRDRFVDFFFPEGSKEGGERAALLFLATSQLLFFLNQIIHASRRAGFLQSMKIHPSVVFMHSFTLIILIGTALLRMPKASRPDIPLIDIFFTAVSATCVTGLSTFDITTGLTRTGQIILLGLIQVGGLGLMTLTSFFSFYLAGRASLTQQMFMKELLSEDSLTEAKNIIRSIALMTFSIEAAGAVNLYFSIPASLVPDAGDRLFVAIFTSISAFCNAGFSLFPDSLYSLSLQSPYSIYTVMLLIILGGLGFPVLRDILSVLRFRRHHTMRRRLEFTSRIVLLTTVIMLVTGFLGIILLEDDGVLAGLSGQQYWLHSLFYAVTPRTAGFNTISVSQFGTPLTFFTLLLMWIGASPVSTAGGIKTTTIAVALIHIVNVLRGKTRIEIFKRSISETTIIRAYSTVLLSLMVIFAGIFAISIFEKKDFLDIAFEVVSAYGTVGLSRGITADLSLASKLILCVIMLTGRVGVLTFLISIVPSAKEQRYRYPSEYVVVG
jgi:potassium uptake TrkH family protein